MAFGGPAIGEPQHPVVPGSLGPGRLHRPRRDHEGVGGGVTEPAVVAVVAGRGDHHDAVFPSLLHRQRERIDPVVLGRIGPEGEGENPDVEVTGGAVLNHPVDGSDHLGDVRQPDRVGDSDAHDPRLGCHPEVMGLEVRPSGSVDTVVAGHDRRQVGAVTVEVQVGQVGESGVERDVGSVDDLGALQTRDRGDARVDESDVDSFSGHAPIPELGGSNDLAIDVRQ